MANVPTPLQTHAYSLTKEAKQLLSRINITSSSRKFGKMDTKTTVSPETKIHHENMALYMFAGLVVTFVFISSIILFVELYKNGQCTKTKKQKKEKQQKSKDKTTNNDIELTDIS